MKKDTEWLNYLERRARKKAEADAALSEQSDRKPEA